MDIGTDLVAVIQSCFVLRLLFLLVDYFDFAGHVTGFRDVGGLLRLGGTLHRELLRFDLFLPNGEGRCVSRWCGEILDLGEEWDLHL